MANIKLGDLYLSKEELKYRLKYRLIKIIINQN